MKEFLKNLPRFIFSRLFLKQVLIAFVILIIIYFLNSFILARYTHRNQALTVPDLKGYTMKQVEEACRERGLNFRVIDSIYVPDVPFFTVIDQSPKSLAKVKKNRTIYLTISSDKPPIVKMPDLTDVSLRQALAILASAGLKAGELEYVPDIAQNVVLRMKIGGRMVMPEQLVKKGSVVDLVLGDGLTSEKVLVQDYRGLTLEEATFALAGVGLNVGAVIVDKGVDSARAIIYRQYPLGGPDVLISQGESVDLWLTSPENFRRMNLSKNDSF